MKKLAFLSLFAALTFAQAANADYRNLSGITPCFDSSVVQVSSSAKGFVEEKEVYEIVRNKFLAYRARFLDDCQPNDFPYPWFVHIYIQAKSSKNGLLVYYIELNVYDRGILPGWQSIYNLGSFGMG